MKKSAAIGVLASLVLSFAVVQHVTRSAVAAAAPACDGTAPGAAKPDAPHGIYVWNPYREGRVEPLIERYVLGPGPKALDPDICGASIVVLWSNVETSKGQYDYSQIDRWVQPYVKVGLRVNLLFADASELCCTNTATPDWVFTQDNVPKVQCPQQPPYPNWLDPTFQADYEQFIDAVVRHFSTGGGAPYAANIGYIRFGTGAGAEAYPGHIESLEARSTPCLDAWARATPKFSYEAWLRYTLEIVRHLAREQTDKQLMVSLNYVSTYDRADRRDAYTFANAVAAVAAPNHVAMGVQNLGIYAGGVPVAAANVAPRACNPRKQFVNIYWCQAYTRHQGVVPLEFQPIVSPIDPGSHELTIAHLFAYGLANHAQIFEIYPQDWVFKDYPAKYPSFTAATAAEYNAAFAATSSVLGRNQ